MKQKKLELSKKSMKELNYLQRDEITESEVYRQLAIRCKDPENKKILSRIAKEEAEHAATWENFTGIHNKPKQWKIWLNKLIARIFGFTFAIKKMEMGEKKSQKEYTVLIEEFPEAGHILETEKKHENLLISMLDESRLHYIGSMVLGLNDALVELTGALVGMTFALQNNRLVALSGIITGSAATLSMAASEFLSARNDGRKDAVKSSLYTGGAYLVTVILLIIPYLILPVDSYVGSLVFMFVVVISIIFLFNYYTSVVQGLPFWKRFGEMAVISLSVSIISFVIGILAKRWLGIDIG